MADKPKGSRDTVRLEPNERVDLPDMKALQSNGRSESRLLLHNFIFGHGDMGIVVPAGTAAFKPLRDWATGPTSLTDEVTNWSKSGSLTPYLATTPTATTIKVNAVWMTEVLPSQTYGGAATGVLAGEVLENGQPELGVAAGVEGDDYQILDYNGKPAGDYGLYVTATHDPGELGSRLFWNAATAQEDTQSVDTRGVAGWNVVTNLLSGGPPTDAAVLVGTVTWSGSTITAYTSAQNHVFEGLTNSTNGKGSLGSYAQGWGQDGSVGTNLYGHRSNIRFLNGVMCWQDWAAAIRSQLTDILGDDDGDGVYGWYTQVPRFDGSGGSTGIAGQMCSLMRARDHIQSDSNPHGATLTQTDLNVRSDLKVESSAAGLADNVVLQATNVTIKAAETGGTSNGILLDSNTRIHNDFLIMSGSSSAIKTYDVQNGETIDDARTVRWFLGPSAFTPGHDYQALVSNAVPSLYRMYDVGYNHWGESREGGNGWWTEYPTQANQDHHLHCSLTQAFNMGVGYLASQYRIKRVYFYFYSNPAWAGATYSSAATVSAKKRQVGTASMGTWTRAKLETFSQGAAGTVGDINSPPGTSGSRNSPNILSWDLTSDADADWTIGGGYEWEFQVRLRGDNGSQGSPIFLGMLIEAHCGQLF